MSHLRPAGSVVYSSSSSSGGGDDGTATPAINSPKMLERNKERICTAETSTEFTAVLTAEEEGNVNSGTEQKEDRTAIIPIPPAPVKVRGIDSEIKPGMRVLFRLPRTKTITTTTTRTLLKMGSTTEWQLGKVMELLPSTNEDDDDDYSQDGNDNYDDKSRGCVTSSNDIIAVIIGLTGRFSEERPIRTKLRYVRKYSYDGSTFDLNDLSILPEPSDAALLYSLRERFFEGLHYTFVGRVMLAVNPYQHSEYSPDVPHPRQVSRTARDLLLTHKSSNFDNNNNNNNKDSTIGGNIYDTVRTGTEEKIEVNSSHSLSVQQRPVVLIVTGDSGAGKTETAKLVLFHFLAESVSGMKTSSFLSTSGTSENVSKHILEILEATNCLLESFGNASTPLNDNSSRFTKCVTVFIDSQTGKGVGARIECYLLEVSRLISRLSGESTFHIFNMMFANREGLTPEEQYRFDILDPTLFRSMYSSAGDVYLGASPYTFSRVRAALELVGLDNEKIDSIIRILSGILHLLNVEFASRDLFAPAFIVPTSMSSCKKAAELLGFSSTNEHDSLETMLTTVRLGGEIRQLHSAAAESTRDSVAKHLYESLFQYILHVINKALLPINAEVKQYGRFSLLDIFGFEVKEQKYGNNDLEQLLINYTNETIQHLYEETTFDALFTEALREGVQLELPREEEDQHSSCTYNIFVQKPQGILNIINDDSLLSQRSRQEGGKNLAEMLASLQKSFPHLIKPHRTDPTKVSIQHYCAKVLYDTENMSVKNRISTAASLICATSTDNFILDICKTISSLPTGEHSSSIKEGGIGLFSPRSHATTLISRFRAQLEGIISQLKNSELLWIKCIKPNNNKNPNEFDSTLVLSQLKSGAVLKSLMLFGKGYCHSFSYKDFVRNYLSLAVRGYCCDALENSSSSKDIYTSSSSPSSSSSFSTRRVFEKSKLRKSSISHIRLQQVAPYYDAVYRASLREACFLVTQLIPCCMNNAFLLGSSKVFMRSSTLRNLLELGDVAKKEAIHLIERVGRAYIERCSLATVRFSKLREKRLAAIRDRITEEMPKREILEVERESLLMKSCEGRAELLASLSRQAMKSSKRVEKQWKESMNLMTSELQKSFDEMLSYETLRLRKEKEVRDEASIEKMYKTRAWEAVEREKRERRQAEMAKRQAVKNSTAVVRRSCADVDAERVKAIQREIIHARQVQLRAEQEVLLERRQREVQLREQREAKEVRKHLDRQQRRIAEQARRREEMTQRKLITGSLPRSDQSSFTISGVDRRSTSGDPARDHTVCGLVMSPSLNMSRTASQMSLPFESQKERRTDIGKDGCDPEVEWAIQKDMMTLWESLQSRTRV